MCGFYDPSTNSYLRFIWAVFKLLSPFIFFCTPQTRESLPVWEAIVGNLMWFTEYSLCSGFPGGASGKEPTCQCRRLKRRGFYPWVRKIPWRRACNPLQYSCLENPMDRGAWQVTVHRVTRSRTQLKGISTCIYSRPTEGRIRQASSTDDSLRHFEAWYLQ